MSRVACCASLLLFVGLVGTARADVFNMPPAQDGIEFVTVGDPGNAPDTTGYGAVGYTYQIGKYDVTSAQYCQFLNAVAPADPYSLYGSGMWNGSAAGGCGIVRSGTSGSYTYSVVPDSGVPGQAGYANYANFPVNYVTWGDAARFCNWLENGQPSGAEGPGTTETGSYTLNGATSQAALLAVTRNPGAVYVLPTADEWYKASYYKGGGTNAGYWLYPTQSDTAPVNILSPTGTNNANFYDRYGTGTGGFTDPVNYLTAVGDFADSPGPYGTFDMGGDVDQWTEAVFGFSGSLRGISGIDFGGPSDCLESSLAETGSYPASGSFGTGFRVAEVPEPSSFALLLAAAVVAVVLGVRRRTKPPTGGITFRKGRCNDNRQLVESLEARLLWRTQGAAAAWTAHPAPAILHTAGVVPRGGLRYPRDCKRDILEDIRIMRRVACCGSLLLFVGLVGAVRGNVFNMPPRKTALSSSPSATRATPPIRPGTGRWATHIKSASTT